MISGRAAAMCAGAACLLLAATAATAGAQELEPRAYSASPVGATFVGAGAMVSTGGIVTDPTLPISDASAHVDSFVPGVGRTFAIAGRQALITGLLPYAWASASGNVGTQTKEVRRMGLTDGRVKLSVNFKGSPAQTPQEFAKTTRPPLLVGASLSVGFPSGQYDSTRLINLGTNRWSIKPEVGGGYTWRKFDLESYVAVTIFADNPRFFPGDAVKRQDPLAAIQAHLSYSWAPTLWAAVDGTWYGGGVTHVTGKPASTRQSNSRAGATLSLPFKQGQSLKLSYSRGAAVNFGANFESFGVSWQIVWFGDTL